MSHRITMHRQTKEISRRSLPSRRTWMLAVGVLLHWAATLFAPSAHADILIVGDADANLYRVDGVSVLSNGPYNWGQPQNQGGISAIDRQSDGTLVVGTSTGLVGRVNGANLGQLNGDGQYSFGGAAGSSVVGVSVNAADNIFVALSNAHAGVLHGTNLGTLTANGAYKFGAGDPAPPFTAFTTKPGQAFLGTGAAHIGGLNDVNLAQLGGNGEFRFGKDPPAAPITAMAINSAGNILAGTEARHLGVVNSSTFGGTGVQDGPFRFLGPENSGEITAIATDGLGNAYVGLDTGHLGKINDVNLGTILADGPYRYGVTDPAVSPISFIVVNSDGNPIIGTTTGWIALLDKNTLGEIASVKLNLAGNALTSALIFVPEPASVVLVAMSGVVLLVRARRRSPNLA